MLQARWSQILKKQFSLNEILEVYDKLSKMGRLDVAAKLDVPQAPSVVLNQRETVTAADEGDRNK